MSNKISFTREKLKKKAASTSDNFPKNYSLVLEVGLEPTKPYGGRFTVSCDCHYTIPAWNLLHRGAHMFLHAWCGGDANGADSRTRTEDLLFTKQLL